MSTTPKKLKIASWNINSVRFRLELVERFLREEQPDVLCLQETKVINNDFPAGLFRQLGYNFHVIHGQPMRSEEHTSELQSLMRTSYTVLVLKKKQTKNT